MRKILTALKERIQSWLASCRHVRLTRPFRDGAGDYQRCLDCGSRIQCLRFGNNKPPWGRVSMPVPETVNAEAADACLKSMGLEEKTS